MGEIEHRQFGRRPSHIAARVVLPGHVTVPCIIENLSDGGALLGFDEPPPTASSFRLAVEDTSFILLCEPRHTHGNKMGIRFARLGEGVALNRHFQKTAVEPAVPTLTGGPAPRPAIAAVSVRDLRNMLLVNAEEEAGDPAVNEAELLAAGRLPPGMSFPADSTRPASRRPARIVRPKRGVTIPTRDE